MRELSIFSIALERVGLSPEALGVEEIAKLKADVPSGYFKEAADTFSILAERGVSCLSYFDPNYPPLLRETKSPPGLLYLRGQLPSFSLPWIAIVGSRSCSREAREFSKELAREIATRGGVVVSGLAYGCDAAAHRGALAANSVTAGVAVLGSGVLNIYPPEHEELADTIIKASGAVISESRPDASPRKGSFPARNRIISGLCSATIVVEARGQSGSLITARLAAEQGREVFVVPASPFNRRSEGGNQLIKDGARILTSMQDLDEFFPTKGLTSHTERSAPPTDPILCALQDGPLTFEDLRQQLSLAPDELLPRLSMLELEGEIYCDNGVIVKAT